MPILPREHYPRELQHDSVAGVFVGGCVSRGDGSRFRAKAHAHIWGQYCGWICVLSEKRLDCRELILHELAHVISRQGHTDKWRRVLLSIGGTLDAYDPQDARVYGYHKKRAVGHTVKHLPTCPCFESVSPTQP